MTVDEQYDTHFWDCRCGNKSVVGRICNQCGNHGNISAALPGMKTIIAGGRKIAGFVVVEKAIRESGFTVSMVICGCAEGVDTTGRLWAEKNGIPVWRFPADWSKHGRAAGPIRNQQMAENADALIAVWDGKSAGTKNMIECAKKRGLKIYVKDV